ncbi:type III secretion system export apparatus subunit SctT [Pandoraea sp. ISTKB]|uniref:type III secretion system export apparatus subunit SctT n=1 Tax=Pandoraea sp. ISTKB TaxID=1586708 RepID=UPI000846C1A3|nr:type III secretion system export apparatus subunit SctT [Pandoraea sp. ISTKB]ODP34724.1 EscT/YscT/HrcT family type III secretion system export apparatus protein [Pandoraea sp. ISTKB]
MLDLTSFFNALQGLHSNVEGLLYMIALSSIRVLVLFLVLPPTGSQAIPGLARAGIVYLLTGFIAAGQSPADFDGLSAGMLLMLTLKESLIGLLIGYASASIFWIAQSAGVIIDDLTGFNNVQMTNPQQGDQSTPVSNLLLQLASTLFYVAGGMPVVLGVVFSSFHWWPLASTLPDFQTRAIELAITTGGGVTDTAVRLATPIMLALVLVDVGLGIVARAAGKLEPSSLSQPVRGFIGVLMLATMTLAVADQVRDALHLHGFSELMQNLSTPTGTVGTGDAGGATTAPATR